MRTILLCATLSAAGCATFEPAAVLPAHGRAYFIRQLAGQSLWVCDATSGRPVCFEATHAPPTGVTGSEGSYAQAR